MSFAECSWCGLIPTSNDGLQLLAQCRDCHRALYCSDACQMNHLLSLYDEYDICSFPFQEGEYSEDYTGRERRSELDDGKRVAEATTESETERISSDDTGFEAEDEKGTFSDDSLDELSEHHKDVPNYDGTDLERNDIFTGLTHIIAGDTTSPEVEFLAMVSPSNGCFKTAIPSRASSDEVPSADSYYNISSSEEELYIGVDAHPNTLETPNALKRSAPDELPQWTPSPTMHQPASHNKRRRVAVDVGNCLDITEALNSIQSTKSQFVTEEDQKSIEVGDDYLEKLPREELFKQLIDCFRVYMNGKTSENIGRFGRLIMPNVSLAFEDMLSKAASIYGFMPSWWDHRAYEKCVEVARDRRRCSNIFTTLDERAIAEDYEDLEMPLKLNLLAAKIFGSARSDEKTGNVLAKMKNIMPNLQAACTIKEGLSLNTELEVVDTDTEMEDTSGIARPVMGED